MDIYFNEARSFSDGKSDMDRHYRAKTFADASHLFALFTPERSRLNQL